MHPVAPLVRVACLQQDIDGLVPLAVELIAPLTLIAPRSRWRRHSSRNEERPSLITPPDIGAGSNHVSPTRSEVTRNRTQAASARDSPTRASICSATYAASLPTPVSTVELNAYWNASPQKNRPGASGTTPRISRGQPSAPKIGRSIQSNICRKPVHHTTFFEVGPLDPDVRSAMEPDLLKSFAAHGCPPGEHMTTEEHDGRKDKPHRPAVQSYWHLTGVTTGQHGRVGGGNFQGDVGP